jgi:hypothetical protein
MPYSKYSPKQKKLAAVAPPRKKITGADLKALKKGRKKLAKGGKPGLWANIHAKRKRIAAGSGERMRKKGEKGAPTAAQMKAAQGKAMGGEIQSFEIGGAVKSGMHRGCGAVMPNRRKKTKYS